MMFVEKSSLQGRSRWLHVDDLIKQASVLLTFSDPFTGTCQRVTGFFVAVDLIASCAHGFLNIVGQCRQLRLNEPDGFQVIRNQILSRGVPIKEIKGAHGRKLEELQVIYSFSRAELGQHENQYYTEEEFHRMQFKVAFDGISFQIPLQHFYDALSKKAFPEELPDCCVYYNAEQDCCLLQLRAEDARWDIEPLRIGTGWKRGELLLICGFPESASEQKLIVPGSVAEVSVEMDRNARNSHHKMHGHFYFHSERSLQNVNLQGLSGSAVVTEDGVCIGIQIERLPTSGPTGSAFNLLLVTPASSIHQLMEHRIELEYRPLVYKEALSALLAHSSRRKTSLKTTIITHQSDRWLAYKLRSYLIAISQARSDLAFDFFLNFGHLDDKRKTDVEEAEVIIIALSSKGQQDLNISFSKTLTSVLRAHHENGTLLLRFDVTRAHHWPQQFLNASFDVSETRSFSEFTDGEIERALARIALRIRQLLDREPSDDNAR